MNKLQKGFTLVELMIAMAVGMIIMAAIYAMMNLAQGTSGNVTRRVLTQQDARAVLDLMAREVSMASFNPMMLNSTWNGNMLGNCSAIVMTQARKGIQVANATQIGVAMDLGGDTTTTPGANIPSTHIGDAPNEYIVYQYNVANGTLSRSAGCEGEVILGGAGSSTMLRNNAAGIPLFQYFNISNTEIAAPDNASIPLIKRIRINLVVDVENEEKRGLPKVSRRTYSTDVLVRNHAFSP